MFEVCRMDRSEVAQQMGRVDFVELEQGPRVGHHHHHIHSRVAAASTAHSMSASWCRSIRANFPWATNSWAGQSTCLTDDLKARSRDFSLDLTPKAIAKRLDIAGALYDADGRRRRFVPASDSAKLVGVR